MRTNGQHEQKKIELMEACFDCYCENGLLGTGTQALANHCGMNKAFLYTYFDNLDDLIIQSTAHCMTRVEDDFMKKAPTNPADLFVYIDEIPYWTAKEHGKKYRFMYQVYNQPKYHEEGKRFFEGVNQRYTEYSKLLAPKLGLTQQELLPLIFFFVRTCVHYAMFEDEFYMREQIKSLKKTIMLLMAENSRGK